ncbi:ATP-binding protein [Gordonia sp. L191]|uniref:sensor histidine kinase n=1 Tax=Gordonia sp. L191 TaxID=2982699 RepID=UPI0024C05113|nr:ATP-binding protein [Gordonia sp. L191]WHU48361.1 ATP-binding protein [Gordonia sp. L191]
MGPREARIQRLMAQFVGGGFLAYFAVSAGEFAPTAHFVAAWYTPVAIVAAFVPGILLFLYSFRRSLDQCTLTALAYLTSTGYLSAIALWLVAWDGVAVEVDQVTWLMSFGGLPSLAIVLVWPLSVSAVHLLACSAASTAITNLGRSGVLEWGVVPQIVWGVAYSSIFLVASSMIRRTGRSLDTAREAALAVTASTAAATARDVERARFDALVHDHVIATLLAARHGVADHRLALQAGHALAQLDSPATSVDDDLARDPAAARLRAGVSAVSDAVPVMITDAGDVDDSRYPGEAVAAIAEAIGESVRNSRRHAGADAECAVYVEFGPGHLHATVIDDGRGFDVGSVPSERLGIEVSIRLRMASIPGGRLAGAQRPGHGTAVGVWWRE